MAIGIGLGPILGQFALRLEGEAQDVTLLTEDVDGGAIYADVALDADPAGHFPKKHLGAPRYEPFDVSVGHSMSSGLFDWIAGSWGASPQKRDGAVLALDHKFAVKTEADFADSLVTETTIPALDASTNVPGHLTVRIRPEAIEAKEGVGKLSLAGSKQRLLRSSRFRLEIAGLDCTKVSRIDSFTVKREVTEQSGGTTLVPGQVEFPNLRITLSQASAATWYDWHKDFVVDGNNGEQFERAGSLSFLTADLKKELSRIELSHLGIVRLAPTEDQSARVTAELYCEEMVLAQPKAGP